MLLHCNFIFSLHFVTLHNVMFIYTCVCVKNISGRAKFAPTYASIFVKVIETNFLDTQELKLLVWFR